MSTQSKKILILGANGFIGSSLCAHLLAKTPHEVYAVDLDTHKSTQCLAHPRFHFYERDLLIHHADIQYFVRKCDIIFPLVAIATPESYVTNPLSVFELDFEANLQIVRWCVQYQKRVIFPSTSEVYGMAPDAVFEEHATNLVVGPIEKQRWIYSCCKQLMDRMLYAYGFEKSLDYTIFRPFNFIGAKLDDIRNDAGSRLLTQFLHNIFQHQPITLVDGGKNCRCFTYIEDGIDCLLRIIENKNHCATHGIFNIGNPNENYSVAEVAQTLKTILAEFDPALAASVQTQVVSAEAYYGKGYQDVARRVPSIREAQTKLGWSPRTSFPDALRKILQYHFQGIDSDAQLLSSSSV